MILYYNFGMSSIFDCTYVYLINTIIKTFWQFLSNQILKKKITTNTPHLAIYWLFDGFFLTTLRSKLPTSSRPAQSKCVKVSEGSSNTNKDAQSLPRRATKSENPRLSAT